MVIRLHSLRFYRHRDMLELGALDHCYPAPFVLNHDKISTQLQLLSNDTLLNSVCRFCASVPSGQ